MKKKAISTIKSSPKAGIDTKAPEGEVRTRSEIAPKDTEKAEQSKLLEIEKKTSGQRQVNLIWETTQAIIAGFVTGAVIYCAIRYREVPQILGNAFTLIIAIYFVRMNHTKTGGVGGTDSR